MPGLILAAVTPDNTPGGYNFTYLFPMLLFIIVALILYALFSRPHRRIPAEPISAALGRRPAAQMQSAATAGPASASAEPAGGTEPAAADAAVTGTGQDAAAQEDAGAGE